MNQAEKVVFGSSLEALWRALAPLTSAEREAFVAAGVTASGTFAPAYPLSDYLRILEACARERFKGQDEFEGFRQLGHLFFAGFGKTVIGGALMAMLKVLGPRRTLERMTRNFRTANNYTEVTTEALGAGHHLVKVNYVVQPGFYLGIIEAGCRHAGAKGLEVKLLSNQDHAPIYEVRWQA